MTKPNWQERIQEIVEKLIPEASPTTGLPYASVAGCQAGVNLNTAQDNANKIARENAIAKTMHHLIPIIAEEMKKQREEVIDECINQIPHQLISESRNRHEEEMFINFYRIFDTKLQALKEKE